MSAKNVYPVQFLWLYTRINCSTFKLPHVILDDKAIVLLLHFLFLKFFDKDPACSSQPTAGLNSQRSSHMMSLGHGNPIPETLGAHNWCDIPLLLQTRVRPASHAQPCYNPSCTPFAMSSSWCLCWTWWWSWTMQTSTSQTPMAHGPGATAAKAMFSKQCHSFRQDASGDCSEKGKIVTQYLKSCWNM